MTDEKELIGPEEARRSVQAGEALLVCAYDDEEQARQNLLEGAILLGELEARRDAGLEKDKALIFYCACPHEEAALEQAGAWREAGFSDVKCLEGGVDGWKAAGFELANDLAKTSGGQDDDAVEAGAGRLTEEPDVAGEAVERDDVVKGDSYGEADEGEGKEPSAQEEQELVGTTQASGMREAGGDEEGPAIGEAPEATGMRKQRLVGSAHGGGEEREGEGEPPRTRARSSRARSRSKDMEAVPGGHHPTGRGSQSDGQYEAFGQVSQGASEGEGRRAKDEDEVPSGHERADRGMRSDGRFESQGMVDEEVGARSDQEPEEADAAKLNEAGKQATAAAGAMEAGARATRRLRAGRGKKGVPLDAGADVPGSSSAASEEKPSRGRRSEGKKARDVMTRDPSFVEAGASVQEAACLMRDQDIGSLPVRDADGRFCGMITDRDISIRCVAEGKELGACKVEECMTKEFVACDEDAAVTEVGRTMQEHQIRRIPVLKKGEADKAHPAEIVGIISLGDLATDLQANIPAATLKKVSQPAHSGA